MPVSKTINHYFFFFSPAGNLSQSHLPYRPKKKKLSSMMMSSDRSLLSQTKLCGHCIAHVPHGNCSSRASHSPSSLWAELHLYNHQIDLPSAFNQVTSLTGASYSLLQGNVSRSLLSYNSLKAFICGTFTSNPASTSREMEPKCVLSAGFVKSAIH